MIAMKHQIAARPAEGNLAVVNRGGVFFDTGFILGDHMTLECCFLVPSAAATTGSLLVGYDYEMAGNDDSKDFRLFFHSERTVSFDAGASSVNGQAARYSTNLTRGVWHVARGPVADGVIYDDGFLNPEFPVRPDGNYGTAPNVSMYVFGPHAYRSQLGAIRYITVSRYGSRVVLCNLVPDKRGGFFDTVTKSLILPTKGSVEIVDWRAGGLDDWIVSSAPQLGGV